MADVFDLISPDESDDVFSEIEQEDSAVAAIREQMSNLADKIDSRKRRQESSIAVAQIEAAVRHAISQIKPVQKVIERQVEQIVRHEQVPMMLPPPPAKEIIVREKPQIIRETRIETEKPDTSRFAEKKAIEALEKKIEQLSKDLKEAQKVAEFLSSVGGSGVIGIPAPEGSPSGYVLTRTKDGMKWQAATGGASGSPDVYTVTNVNTKRTFDPTTSNMADVANVLGSLLASLKAAGIVQ